MIGVRFFTKIARQLALNIGMTGFLIFLLLMVGLIAMAPRITTPLRALSEMVFHISMDSGTPLLWPFQRMRLARLPGHLIP